MQGKLDRIRGNAFAFSVPHAVTRVFREQNRAHGRAVQPFGLSTEQAHLLVVLWERGPMTMTELGREVALSTGTLSTAIDRMETAGLVTRVQDLTDRRAVRIEPVAWPKARKDQLVATLLAAEESLVAPLSAKERRTLYDLLERVLAHARTPKAR
jgi:MarR family transcriptional regulator, organic hydroperoxide resistance regulator